MTIFTLNMPGSIMVGIKNVVFLDAGGQAIEGHRAGSGHLNEAAELSFSVKTVLKTLTLEFEQWQNERTIKVSFKIGATIGL